MVPDGPPLLGAKVYMGVGLTGVLDSRLKVQTKDVLEHFNFEVPPLSS